MLRKRLSDRQHHMANIRRNMNYHSGECIRTYVLSDSEQFFSLARFALIRHVAMIELQEYQKKCTFFTPG